jgi:hypothetical protein
LLRFPAARRARHYLVMIATPGAGYVLGMGMGIAIVFVFAWVLRA